MDKEQPESLVSLISWALYDWASGPFFAIIQTFVFATYFMQQVAVNDTIGSAQWGNTIGAAGLLIAICAPFMGAAADQMGRRKPWIGCFTILAITATMGLWFVEPSQQWVFWALLMVFLGTVGSEFSLIFYNAMLPDIASEERMGRWSGWGWGLGYVGGLLCLVIALLVFVDASNPPFGLDKANAEHIRATFWLVAGWYALFAIPMFLFTSDRSATGVKLGEAVQLGWQQLKTSVHNVRRYKYILQFLIARMIFIDALATVFAFGGIYAAGTFSFSTREILMFGIGLNLTAGIGAVSFAWMDDKLGSRTTMLVSLAGLIVCTTSVLLVQQVILFWIFGLMLGIFVGPVQAASRTYLARVAPKELQNQMFGLMALSGKVTAFVGPFLVGWLTYLFESQRMGMSVIILFFRAFSVYWSDFQLEQTINV